MSRELGVGPLKDQHDSSQTWVPWEPDSVQSKEVEAPAMAVYHNSLASDPASEAASVGSLAVASADSSGMVSADKTEVALGSTSEAGASSGKAILVETGEHRDLYLYPWRERQSSDGWARPFAPSDREVD